MNAPRRSFRLDIGTPTKPDHVSNSFATLTALKKAMEAQLMSKRTWCHRFAPDGIPHVDQARADAANTYSLDARPVVIDCKFDPTSGTTMRLTCWHDNY